MALLYNSSEAHRRMAEVIQQMWKQNLGIDIEYIAVNTDEVPRRVITQPNSFDLVDSEYFSLPNLVPSGNMKGMDASRIDRIDQLATVISEGTVNGEQVGWDGTAPHEVLMVIDGTTAHQRLIAGTLDDLPARAAAETITGPTLLIVGEVVRLNATLGWFRPTGDVSD